MILRSLDDPNNIFNRFIMKMDRLNWLDWMSDEAYLKLMYRLQMGSRLDLVNPITYNEKLQWLKLHDRRPEYIIYADKLAVRDFYEQTIGADYLIPLIGAYDGVEEIPWEELPDQFVLKCTHGSGTNIICADKSRLDIEASQQQLQRWLRTNYFWHGREWPYRCVNPRIICEQFMVDESGIELKDYKVFCFNGEPKMVEVDFGRFTDHKRNLYDTRWNFLTAAIRYPNDPSVIIDRPTHLEEMLELARVLSAGYPHIRVDFYFTGERIYIGEMTLYHASGWGRFDPPVFGIEMGGWIELPSEKGKPVVAGKD